MQAFECTGLWWLPQFEEDQIAGTLSVSANGNLKLALVDSLGHADDPLSQRVHPIIVGSVETCPLGNDITLTHCIPAGKSIGPFLGAKESYHARMGYFGAPLTQESEFVFNAMALRLGGLTEWMHHLSGFEWKHPPVFSFFHPAVFFATRTQCQKDSDFPVPFQVLQFPQDNDL